MKKRLLIAMGSLIILITLSIIAWYLTSSRPVSETVEKDSSSGVSEEALVQVVEKDQRATATGVVETATAAPDPATEEARMSESRTEVQPTSIKPQATATQPANTQVIEVQPTEPQPSEIQLTANEPTPTHTVEPQTTESPALEIEATQTQPAEVLPSTTPPADVEPAVILQGNFKDADSVHKGSGSATIYQRSDSSYFLSFKDFAVCCGPDLYVFLADNPAPTGHADLGNYVELSSLQASSGDQDYEISADADLSQFKSVVIYCKPFQVIISTATFG